jgi:hypothetical protein
MAFSSDTLLALLVTISFAAGLNVYATVATLGILARVNLLPLPPSLHLLFNRYVIGACVALFLVELFADKIPVFDLLWNALQTFVRIPVAALIAYQASANLSPPMQLLSGLLGALVALAAHGGKTAVRAAMTPSPEPFSNIALSFSEDVFAVFLLWLAARHPYWAAGIVVAFLAAVVILIRWVIRALRSMFSGAERHPARGSNLTHTSTLCDSLRNTN